MMPTSDYATRFNLKGKSAMVTGGAGLLGREFCNGLAEFGANVAVIDLDEGAASKVAKELTSRYAVKAVGLGCDITQKQAVTGMVERTVAAFGCIDILVNSAGWKSKNVDAFFAAFENYSLDEWRRVMAVNVDGVFLVDQAVGAAMVRNGRGGSIIHIGSIYGAYAPDQRIYEGSQFLGRSINTPAIYSASKAAVVGLTQYLATYWAPQGIRVNCISPGGVESGQNDEFVRRYSARVPLARMARSGEMVNAVLYLASEASSYVTGQNLLIDGGLSIW